MQTSRSGMPRPHRSPPAPDSTHPGWTLVWIDAREAVIVRWRDENPVIERLESEVPAHRASTGHVRRDPRVRHGGGGTQTAGEPHRLEHLARFVDQVASRLADDDGLEILGPGQVRQRLTAVIREKDQRRRATRPLHCIPSPRRTDAQLVARLRLLMGADPARVLV
jgi:hypothetical protein